MQNTFSRLDHIVLGAPSLQEGIDYVENLTGCRAVFGGKHQQFGTQNALLKIGNLIYLEILAPDPDNPKSENLWMGISELDKPRVTRYAIKSKQIAKDAKVLNSYEEEHGFCQVGKRVKSDGELLKWELTVPLAMPKTSCIPFLIDWGTTIHPSISLKSCAELLKFERFSPNYVKLNSIFEDLNLNSLILPGPEKIVLTLECPKGIIELS